MKNTSRVLLLSLTATTSLSTTAWGYGGRTSADVSASGGIAMPSAATSVFTNPAGLADQRNTQLLIQAGAPQVWDNPTYRGGLQTGNGSFGVSAGIEDQRGLNSDSLAAFYGLAVGTQTFSLGVGAKTGISDAGHATTVNAGLLVKPNTTTQLGITARGLEGGPGEYGVGAAFELSTGLSLVVDSAMDDQFKEVEFKPGIKVGNQDAALTLSYGTATKQQFSDGFTAGGSFLISPATSLEMYYNHGNSLSEYYAALSLGF